MGLILYDSFCALGLKLGSFFSAILKFSIEEELWV